MIKDKLIAHRGWRNRYPENTLPGINAAIEIGAQHIEIDIQLTADGIPVLCHDKLLQRLSGSDQDITQCNFSQIEKLSAYEPHRLGNAFLSTPIPTLKDCVALIKKSCHVTLYVELKTESIDAFGSDAVLDAVLPNLQSIRQHCFLISFDSDILQLARQRGWQHIAPVLNSFEQAFSAETTRLSPNLIFCDKNLLSNENKLEKIAYPTAIYEVDDYHQAILLLDQGASLIETFSIGELITVYSHNEQTLSGKSDE